MNKGPRTAKQSENPDQITSRYEVKEKIASGTFSEVWKCTDTQSLTPVAVKIFKPDLIRDIDVARERFEREMLIIERITHENIIKFYDYGQEDNQFFIVLEYLDGQTVRERLNSTGLSPNKALSVIKQITQGLQAAHDANVIHRDLKPENIILVDSMAGLRAKILDFGFAKLLRAFEDESLVDLTGDRTVGTPRYLAPEQVEGRDLGPQTDLYSLGLLFYEMVTETPAVRGRSIQSVMDTHSSPEPLTLEQLDTVPDRFQPIIQKLVRKSPENRYQSASELISALEEIEANDGPAFSPATGAAVDPESGKIVKPSERDSSESNKEKSTPTPQNAVTPEVEQHSSQNRSENTASSSKPSDSNTANSREDGSSHRERMNTYELTLDWAKKTFSDSPRNQTEIENKSQRTGSSNQANSEIPDADKQKLKRSLSRFSKSALAVIESIVAVFALYAAFFALTTRFDGLPFQIKIAVGIAPIITTVISRFLRIFSPEAELPPKRQLFILWSFLWYVGAHIYGFQTIKANLEENPIWFAGYIEGLPYWQEIMELLLRWAQIEEAIVNYFINL